MMARILGKVQYQGDIPDKYFAYCNTADAIASPLFDSVDALWTKYDLENRNGYKKLEANAVGDAIYIVKISISNWREFNEGGDLYCEPFVGLASLGKVLYPLEPNYLPNWNYSIAEINGVFHLKIDSVSDGWSEKETPDILCDLSGRIAAPISEHSLASRFDVLTPLCPRCSKELLDK